MDGLDVVDLRDLTIKPASGNKIFAWSSSAEIQLLDGDFGRAQPPEKSGTILLDDNQQVFRASERICSREVLLVRHVPENLTSRLCWPCRYRIACLTACFPLLISLPASRKVHLPN